MYMRKVVAFGACVAISLVVGACTCPQTVGSSGPGAAAAGGPAEPDRVAAQPGAPAEPAPVEPAPADRAPATPGAPGAPDRVPATPGAPGAPAPDRVPATPGAPGPDRVPATPGAPGAPAPDRVPATPGKPATDGEPPAPGQGEPCPDDRCADGLTCVSYYGIAGPRGPKFTSCEIRCSGAKSACPSGQICVTIADGPGQVCRPR